MMENEQIKILMLGDHSVGKTSLEITFETGTFPTGYILHVFHSWEVQMIVENIKFRIEIWDTKGENEYDNIRQLSYPHTDVFFICFSLVSKKSFQNIETKWIKEVQAHCPGTPCILVGLKSDLKNHFEENQIQTNLNDDLNDSIKDQLPISTEDIQRMKEKINAEYYFECSSKDKINITELFESACRIKIRNEKEAKSKCFIF